MRIARACHGIYHAAQVLMFDWGAQFSSQVVFGRHQIKLLCRIHPAMVTRPPCGRNRECGRNPGSFSPPGTPPTGEGRAVGREARPTPPPPHWEVALAVANRCLI